MTHDVLTYYLEIDSSDKFKPKKGFEEKVEIRLIKPDTFLHYSLFLGVGMPHLWFERLLWEKQDWDSYLKDNNNKFFLGFAQDQLIGFFDLKVHSENVEIKYFGLLASFVGRGLGGCFLSHAINEAFKIKPKVWLHTCEYDHQSAIKNYEKRGFVKTKEGYVKEEAFTKERFIELISSFYGDYFDEHG